MKTIAQTYPTVNRAQLERKVKVMYERVALHPEVQYHFEMGRALAERLGYPSDVLDSIPSAAIESFAGVGYHFDMARLQPGETVLDLGSGAGMDAFFAAQKVKRTGNVIGLDMTRAQLQKSQTLKEEYDYDQVDFLESYIEELSIISDCIDTVISNGVINLSSDKQTVFREVKRVLKSGGRLAISDIVSTEELPERITCNATLWAACIGGAMQELKYLSLIEKAGLKIIEVKDNPYQFLSNSAAGATKTYGIKSISVLAVKA